MSTQSHPAPDPGPILDYIEAFRRSKTMFTAVRLGVFDRLEAEPQSAVDLAAKLALNGHALSRLLAACVALGLLARDADIYRNTPLASRYLVATSPHTFAGYISYSDESLFRLWSHLEDAVREGSNRWEQTFGSRDALFDYYYRDPQATANFVRAMNGFGVLASDRIVRAFDLSRFRQLVDLGGATGHLAIAACQAYPNLRATAVDLPRVEPFAQEYIAQSPVADRVRFARSDFFSEPLPSGDLYALGRILHDWDDTKTHALLRKIAAALPSGGALLVAEALVNNDGCGPVYALMQDLNMLVCTDGRERTLAEYRGLLEAAGFSDVIGKRTGSLVDAILALKK
jgi:acetylserotonin N-methyltransferase